MSDDEDRWMNTLWDLPPEDTEILASMPVCGCGDTTAVYDLYRSVLRATPQSYGVQPKGKEWPSWEKRVASADGDERLFYVIAYALDHIEATEHGGSVIGAWRTPKGDRLLELLDEWSEKNYDSIPCQVVR